MNKTSYENDLEVWSQFLIKVFEGKPHLLNIFFVVVYLIIFFVSIIGNVLTCIVIYSVKSMHTATNYYLFNLAVSDLIVTFTNLADVYDFVTDFSKIDDFTCQLRFFFITCLWNNGILMMTILAIERYIVIWYPLLLNTSPVWKRVSKVITIIWIVAILESLPDVWSVKNIKTKTVSICFTVPTEEARTINGILALLTFVIPLAIMIFVYTMIAFKVNENEMTSSKGKIFNHRDNRRRVHKIIALTGSFLICWLPFFTYRIMIFAYDMRQLMQFEWWFSTGIRITLMNTWFSVVLNPILFSLMSTKFRRALKMLWTKKFKRECPLKIDVIA
ncbi:neuromedin-U receptor 2-like isoform X2 [Pieris napi]|uniref:neuromedin-U receptor 2-like isoform X2 n=1 Tax=Pieris napi TaxID=78633 RepID=UPI001FB8D10D|nr:neuromedin-U receptor 2-like isoform X2 [Pieris napi]